MLRLFHLFLWLTCLALPAWAGSVALVLSDNSGAYSEFANTFEDSLTGSNWNVSSTVSADALSGSSHADLVVTVGSEALRRALARADSTPILATLLPRLSYERILAENNRRSSRISAIYLDQPPARQAIFIRHLLPNQKRLGVLVSNDTRPQLPAFRQAFASAGFTLDSEDSDSDSALLPALNSLLSRTNALVATPDSSIYRRNNIKAILISAFRHQKPVIGYSAALVNAGALAALHSTPNQLARQAADLVIASGSNLPPPLWPNQFSIAVNPSVAQALGLNTPDEASLRRAIIADRDTR